MNPEEEQQELERDYPEWRLEELARKYAPDDAYYLDEVFDE